MQEMKGEKTSDNKWIREENKNEMTMKKPQISKSDGDMVEKLEWGSLHSETPWIPGRIIVTKKMKERKVKEMELNEKCKKQESGKDVREKKNPILPLMLVETLKGKQISA